MKICGVSWASGSLLRLSMCYFCLCISRLGLLGLAWALFPGGGGSHRGG